MMRSGLWGLIVIAGTVLFSGSVEAKIWQITKLSSGSTVRNNSQPGQSGIPTNISASGLGHKRGVALMSFGPWYGLLSLGVSENVAPVICNKNGRWSATLDGRTVLFHSGAQYYTTGNSSVLLLQPMGSGRARALGGFTVLP